MTDLRAYQPSFTSGELSPALYARTDLAKYAVGLKVARNVFIHPHGGASNRPGLQFVAEVKNSAKLARLIPFEFNTEQTYILEFGDLYMRVFRGGQTVLDGGLPYEIVTTYGHIDLQDLVFSQEADVMYFTHVEYPVAKIGREGDADWTLEDVDFAPSIAAPTGQSAALTVNTGTGQAAMTYAVSAVDDNTGEESLPAFTASINANLSVAGNKNTVTWSAVAGAGFYKIYKREGNSYGYIGFTDQLSFVDQNITADLADGPQQALNPFDGPGNYPRCSTFIEQRLGFFSTKNNPQAAFLSQTANYENFGVAQPTKADDAVTFRIRSRKVNEIRAAIALRGLMLMTSGGEYIVTGGQEAAILPSAIDIDPQGERGSTTLQPIVVGNTVLYAQRRGCVIRDLSYDYASDGFDGQDRTILSRHLFGGKTIKAWAYAQAPNSIIWVVLNDGSLVSLTYMREHEVFAWTRHDTDGVFEDVAVVGEGEEDVPYFIVRREIGGVQKRYIEKLHTREFQSSEQCFFVDSGLTYDGSPASIISGLDHLEGRTIVALADGNVVRDLVVTGGEVTLPDAASLVHLGLPYLAQIKTLDLDLGNVQGLGSVQGRQKSVASMGLRVENTRGIFYGSYEGGDGEGMMEWKQREEEDWNEAIRLFTGDVATLSMMPNWDTGANVIIEQRDPLPMTILAIMPDVKLGA